MITEQRIVRLAEARAFAQLLDQIVVNGRQPALTIRLRLMAQEGLVAVALGLGLQRLLEIAPASRASAEAIKTALTSQQDDRGGFGTSVATASAVGGLLAYRDESVASFDGAVNQAIDRGLQYLASRQAESGLIDDDVQVSAFVAWQLGDHCEFLARIRYGEFTEALDELSGKGRCGQELMDAARIAIATAA